MCAGPRRFAGKAELIGRSHSKARESGRAGKWLIALTRWTHEVETERGRTSEGDWRRHTGPLGRGRESERERAWGGEGTAADRWSLPIKWRGRARGPAGLDWVGLG
jgi:hypothetical protein